jgi:hypothetical protein
MIYGSTFVHRASVITKNARQELEYEIDCILVLLVSFSRGESLLPQELIGALQLVQVFGDGRLVALDGCYPVDDGVDVKNLASGEGGL